jgi:hypothetical protein
VRYHRIFQVSGISNLDLPSLFFESNVPRLRASSSVECQEFQMLADSKDPWAFEIKTMFERANHQSFPWFRESREQLVSASI